jgi:hypothetical protein
MTPHCLFWEGTDPGAISMELAPVTVNSSENNADSCVSMSEFANGLQLRLI